MCKSPAKRGRDGQLGAVASADGDREPGRLLNWPTSAWKQAASALTVGQRGSGLGTMIRS